MADPTDLNLDAPSDLQDIPDLAMQLIPPPEGTYPDKSVLVSLGLVSFSNESRASGQPFSQQSRPTAKHTDTM